MDRSKVVDEIAGLEQKLADLKQEMILTDGALQAFRWVLAEVDKAPVDAVVVEVPAND